MKKNKEIVVTSNGYTLSVLPREDGVHYTWDATSNSGGGFIEWGWVSYAIRYEEHQILVETKNRWGDVFSHYIAVPEDETAIASTRHAFSQALSAGPSDCLPASMVLGRAGKDFARRVKDWGILRSLSTIVIVGMILFSILVGIDLLSRTSEHCPALDSPTISDGSHDVKAENWQPEIEK